MSKKITEAMLKGLVERVLKEEQLNEKGLPVIGINDKGGRGVKNELGIDGDRPSLEKIKQIASVGGNTDDLEKIDFAKVFSETDWTEDAIKTAEAGLEIWKRSKLNPEVREKIIDAYEGSNYHDYELKTSADKNKSKFKHWIDQRIIGASTLKQTPGNIFLMFKDDLTKAKKDGDDERAEDVRAAFSKWLKNKKVDKSITSDELIELDRIFKDFDESDLTVPSMDLPLESTFDQSRTFGKIPSATLSVFNKFKSDTKTVDEVTNKLIDFSNFAENHFVSF